MNPVQPIHKTTGERGPMFDGAILACIWIIRRPDMSEWTWRPMFQKGIDSAPATLLTSEIPLRE